MESFRKGSVDARRRLSWDLDNHIIVIGLEAKIPIAGLKCLALWGVLQCDFWLAIEEIVIAGDSKSVIEWVKGRHSFKVPFLHH